MLNRASLKIGLMWLAALMALAPCVAFAETAENRFLNAEAGYRSLQDNSGKQKCRHNWLNCLKKYQQVLDMEPSGPWAAAALYRTGALYDALSRRSGLAADHQEALNIFESVIKRYPESRYTVLAKKELQRMGGVGLLKTTPKPVEKRPEAPPPPPSSGIAGAASPTAKTSLKKLTRVSSPAASEEKSPRLCQPAALEKRSYRLSKPTASGPTTVSGLRFWSNPNYTRIVIDVGKETTYTHQLLKKDPINGKPPRLYIDFDNSRLGAGLQKTIPINDDLLSDARAGQFTPESVRVVVDIKSFTSYKVFSMRNPFRIIMDVWGETKPVDRLVKVAPPPPRVEKRNIGKNSLARQLALGVSRIVIDAGHGGKDFGAPGYKRGVNEKNITLAVAKRLAQKVSGTLGCEVIMTRTNDHYLTLEERTAIANTSDADLFISIHTNSHCDSRAFGIETYYLNLATDNDAILVAARENATSTKNISDLQTILNDLMNNAKVNESSRLAAHVQHCLCRGLSKRYDRIKDKGVKQAPFYVLLGAQMPAVLIETSFISNARECERLMNSDYQDRLTDAILQGISAYVKEINPTAFMKQKQKSKIKG